ncbi:MAG: glycosyltransferase family 2 protein [Methylococcales bacterium]|nr:glycosyltransferase family 2 protein [Methylococcales bacterium]
MTSYNGGLYIEQQVTSVLQQLSAHDELIIADDGSDDDTLQKIRALADPRIKWLESAERLGVIRNFERALQTAKGEVIFLCDQDDIWLPIKVEQCLDALRESILVVSDCRVVDANLNEISPSFFKIRNSGPGILHNLFKNSYLGCCMAFRRELLDCALPIPPRVPMHDMWLGLMAETRGGVRFLPIQLLLYRRHGLNASPTAEKSPFSLSQKMKYRAVLVWLLLIRALACWRKSQLFIIKK